MLMVHYWHLRRVVFSFVEKVVHCYTEGSRAETTIIQKVQSINFSLDMVPWTI